ncbi:MAG TPA: hypothetical protein VK866_13750 [Acidimicrobiales bacterium]|nr:hypothetical protein [Acidimicrobiales bacterium]
MSRLDDDLLRWLDEAGFQADDDGDDPWGAIEVAVTPLTDAQRAFLAHSAGSLVAESDLDDASRRLADGPGHW